MNRHLRNIGFVVGDIYHDVITRVKSGCLYRSLGKRFSLLTMKYATLIGIPRYLNALCHFHPYPQKWLKRFHINMEVFKSRSNKMAAILEKNEGKIYLIIQDGFMFNS